MRIAILPANKRVKDANGNWASFSHADLDEIAAAYDPKNPAPIVIGHPRTDSPAFGWWEKLERQGDYLFAIAGKIAKPLRDAIAAGAFRKYSASIFGRESTANPTPGRLNLRHVGFLGAASPAFGELFAHPGNDFGLAFSSPIDENTLNFLLSFTDTDMDLNTLKEIEGDISIADIAAAMGVEVEALEALTMPAEETEEAAEEESAAFAEMRRQNAALRAQMDALQLERKRDRCFAFCDGLIKEGRPLPKPVGDIVAWLVSLDEENTADFSETKGITEMGFAMDLLRNLPKQVDFSERAAGSGSDPSADAIATAIRAKQKEGLSFVDATTAVLGGK